MTSTIVYRQGEKPLHEYLRQHAVERPQKPAINWYGAEISFSELDRLSDAFAARLHERGIQKGDRVALFLQNSPQYVIAYLGSQKLGAIVCACSPLFKQFELETQLSDMGARALVAADVLYPVVEQVLPTVEIEHLFLTSYSELLPDHPTVHVPGEVSEAKRPPVDGATDFMEALRTFEGDVPRPEISMSDTAAMSYTSGSTGRPKGAMLPYSQALFKSSVMAEAYDIQASDIMLAVAPLYHIAGMSAGICIPVYTGATTVLLFRFDPLSVLEAIDRNKVTFWYSVTPMNIAVMEHPEASRYRLDSLRLNIGTSFGIPLTEDRAKKWAAFTGGCLVAEAAYGLTETHTWDTCMPLDDIRWGTHGKLSPGVQCRIVDLDTRAEKARGEQGEIQLKGPGLFHGYWNNREAYEDAFEGKWFCTGDIGVLDEDDYLTLLGRKKEMIKVSGYSVFPEDVETILCKHPDITQAVIVGVPHETKGEVVRAVLVMRKGADASADDIIAWCRGNLSAYKVPQLVSFVDHLPTTPTGKVLRRLVKEL
ncbi:AMP-binding protein [Paracoccus jeotgali]|uniref:AMP-dependent synthetase n=1 Tax=Paracoccus jeotgali TaxID=2065379 RepID=A0A2K9MM98_9RHOB|nr:AMP-binding protein [Paracoccus jeotgali]AUM75745.1 AMP-dependent synthetase [Paracoccus jeotgali]